MNILLDRDGTLIWEKDYLSRPEEVELLPGAGTALRSLQDLGCPLFLVSNQSGIGRGLFSPEDHDRVQSRLVQLLAEQGVSFRDLLFCPHSPWEGCPCRKPRTGMWEELVRRHGLRAEESVMIGDKEADLEFGSRAGLHSRILVLTGYGERTAQSLGCPPIPDGSEVLELERKKNGPDLLTRDLEAACAWIQNLIRPERPAG